MWAARGAAVSDKQKGDTNKLVKQFLQNNVASSAGKKGTRNTQNGGSSSQNGGNASGSSNSETQYLHRKMNRSASTPLMNASEKTGLLHEIEYLGTFIKDPVEKVEVYRYL